MHFPVSGVYDTNKHNEIKKQKQLSLTFKKNTDIFRHDTRIT